MSNSKLDRLLEKYYSGNTSTGEENEIRSLLDKGDLPPGYAAEKEMFAAFSEMKQGNDEPSEGFENSIMANIEAVTARQDPVPKRAYLTPLLAVAASLLILIVSYFAFFNSNRPADTFTDPRLAYEQTREVLMMMSNSINTSKAMMSDISYIDRAAEHINMFSTSTDEAAKKLEPISYLDKGLRLINPINDNEKK